MDREHSDSARSRLPGKNDTSGDTVPSKTPMATSRDTPRYRSFAIQSPNHRQRPPCTGYGHSEEGCRPGAGKETLGGRLLPAGILGGAATLQTGRFPNQGNTPPPAMPHVGGYLREEKVRFHTRTSFKAALSEMKAKSQGK